MGTIFFGHSFFYFHFPSLSSFGLPALLRYRRAPLLADFGCILGPLILAKYSSYKNWLFYPAFCFARNHLFSGYTPLSPQSCALSTLQKHILFFLLYGADPEFDKTIYRLCSLWTPHWYVSRILFFSLEWPGLGSSCRLRTDILLQLINCHLQVRPGKHLKIKSLE